MRGHSIRPKCIYFAQLLAYASSMKNFILLFLAALAIPVSSFARALAVEGYFIADPSRQKIIAAMPDLTIDHVSPMGFEVWGPRGLGQWLSRNQIQATPLHTQRKPLIGYPSPEETNNLLAQIHLEFPQITEFIEIGKSAQGRPLFVMKIAGPARGPRDARPEFKFIANMHGDEIVGRELMVYLIRDLASNYGKNQAITNLVNSVQIYIMPSMNPDGAAVQTRANAQGIDLNRDFPDFTTSDNHNNPDGRAPETQAVMRWQAAHHFKLSANFHGGAEVVNYGWDTSPEHHPKFDLIYLLSRNYARLTPYIGNSWQFKDGVTNGYEWYEVNGGMQDWSFYWYNDLQLTVELSKVKWPPYSSILSYYQQNRTALLDFIAQSVRP